MYNTQDSNLTSTKLRLGSMDSDPVIGKKKLAIFGGRYEEESLDRSMKVTWDGDCT